MLFSMSYCNCQLIGPAQQEIQRVEVLSWKEFTRFLRLKVTHERVGVFITRFFARGVFVLFLTTS